MHRRGTTLVEMVLAMSLTALILGALAAMYGFTMVRLAHATANYGATSDATLVAEAIANAVKNATTCSVETSGGNTGLKCVMPLEASDKDVDAFNDSYRVSGVSRRGLERTRPGNRVWFYRAASSGSFASPGTYLFRAERSDDLLPTGDNVDWDFSYATEPKLRYPLISTLSFSVDSTARTVQFTVVASGLARAEKTAPTESADSYAHSETRLVFWRNARR